MADGRQNPRRLRVAPPPGGRRPSDWVGKAVETAVTFYLAGVRIPAGTAATVIGGSHGGSGLQIRLVSGRTCGGVTDEHIRLAEDRQASAVEGSTDG